MSKLFDLIENLLLIAIGVVIGLLIYPNLPALQHHTKPLPPVERQR